MTDAQEPSPDGPPQNDGGPDRPPMPGIPITYGAMPMPINFHAEKVQLQSQDGTGVHTAILIVMHGMGACLTTFWPEEQALAIANQIRELCTGLTVASDLPTPPPGAPPGGGLYVPGR